ncbi:unnamed protein product, partial [Musa acuminata var. zebrina]
DEGREVEVGKAGGRGKGELDHHIVDTMGEGTKEDEVGGDEDKDAQEEKKRSRHHYMPSIRLVDAHLPKVGSKAPELIVNMGEA